jgi:hypothetical protein
MYVPQPLSLMLLYEVLWYQVAPWLSSKVFWLVPTAIILVVPRPRSLRNITDWVMITNQRHSLSATVEYNATFNSRHTLQLRPEAYSFTTYASPAYGSLLVYDISGFYLLTDAFNEQEYPSWIFSQFTYILVYYAIFKNQNWSFAYIVLKCCYSCHTFSDRPIRNQSRPDR